MVRRLLLLALTLAAAGCGTTRTTDTTRAATEMLLVSQAVDKAVGQLDFSPLKGKAVYLDVAMIDKEVVDKGYLISSLRQQLLSQGALVMEEKKQAVYVVEVRTGAIGTDRHSLLFGSPALSVPAIVPGVPTSIPEIALYKRTDQKGVAKIAAFAYNRVTGRAVWQSGLVEDVSRQKDRWVLGSGPYSSGSIRRRTELAGEELPTTFPQLPTFGRGDEPEAPENPPALLPTQAFHWTNGDAPAVPQPVPLGLMGVTGAAPIINHPLMVR
ncbi:DUF6655 family protein [Limnoglobus roseus]|uniref:Uncharacterized protein n=1 Tax=Limnoglobus roseus TaxID=2598579 RepID=A0A5C1A841_9BACT|nr:DUF6655 family protein [Limnoglobus roseus]QEL13338.1 hypothetical protein PX52LOC_00192 [Limnoglobus roseus]